MSISKGVSRNYLKEGTEQALKYIHGNIVWLGLPALDS